MRCKGGSMEEKKNNAVEKVENIIREKNYSKKEQTENKESNKENSFFQKKQENNQKKEENQRKTQDKKEKRGYIAAIISLGIAVLILSSILTFNYLMPSDSEKTLNSGYERAFYDTVEQVNNMDLNLSKATVTKDERAIQKYMLDLAVNSELAESNLQQIPLKDENRYYTSKLVNQIGDFAKYVSKKLIDGDTLSKEDHENLDFLKKANAKLKEALSKTMENMDKDFSFIELKEGEDNPLLDNFNQLENLSVEFPELIYDGPFSDAKEQMEIKGLTGNAITKAEGREKFISYFRDYELKNIREDADATGKIECYCFSASVNDELLYAQISKVGGKLIMFEYRGSCNASSFQEESALEKAQAFLENAGLENMEMVWANESSNEYTFNFVYEKDGVLVYPDMVKVRVCLETDMVIGLDAVSYYANHVEREIEEPSISVEMAKEDLFSGLEIGKINLALVKIGSKEVLCYEFEGVFNDELYYVYIDANSGRQVENFKVVSTKDGTLLA